MCKLSATQSHIRSARRAIRHHNMGALLFLAAHPATLPDVRRKAWMALSASPTGRGMAAAFWQAMDEDKQPVRRFSRAFCAALASVEEIPIDREGS